MVPFTPDDEISLIKRYNIDILINKNRKAKATYAKSETPVSLVVPVLMFERLIL